MKHIGIGSKGASPLGTLGLFTILITSDLNKASTQNSKTVLTPFRKI